MKAYLTPLLLGVCVLGGLALALVSESALDFAALALVAAPLVTITAKVWQSARSRPVTVHR